MISGLPRQQELAALAQSPTLAARLFPQGTVIGGENEQQYVLRSILGIGGMGIVFVALDRELDRECAVKILLPHQHPRYAHSRQIDAAAMLVEEAKTHAKLAERSVEFFIQVHRRGFVPFRVDEGRATPGEVLLPFYSMERLRGAHLLSIIKSFRDEPIPVEEALRLAYQAAEGLAIAHSLGIIHRDLKPNNLFVHRTPLGHTVKTLDFGISTREGERAKGGTGTPRYTAPEILAMSRAAESVQSDMYPLGLVLFELFALRGPFDGDGLRGREQNAVFWNHAHVYEVAPSLGSRRSDLPPRLVKIVDRCLHKEPERRPSSRELADELKALLQEAQKDESKTKAGGLGLAQLLQSVRLEKPSTLSGAEAGQAMLSLASGIQSYTYLKGDVLSSTEPGRKNDVSGAHDQTVDLGVRATTNPGHALEATYSAAVRTLEGLGEAQAMPVFHSTAEMFETAWADDTCYITSPLQREEDQAAISLPAPQAAPLPSLDIADPSPAPVVKALDAPDQSVSPDRSLRARRSASRLFRGMVLAAAAVVAAALWAGSGRFETLPSPRQPVVSTPSATEPELAASVPSPPIESMQVALSALPIVLEPDAGSAATRSPLPSSPAKTRRASAAVGKPQRTTTDEIDAASMGGIRTDFE